jgi:hypothetical protein
MGALPVCGIHIHGTISLMRLRKGHSTLLPPCVLRRMIKEREGKEPACEPLH